MISCLRNRFRAFKRYNQIKQFLGIAEQYEKNAEYHRSMILFHEENVTHLKSLAKSARATARKL